MTDRTKAPIRVITAPNPSPLTGPGTNSFLIGQDSVAVIDPGPVIESHLQALVAMAGPGRISHILVTHAHLDHSPGARRLAALTGAPILGYGHAEAGRSALMQRLAAQGLAGGGEGMDRDFAPDMTLRDGDVVETAEWRLTALHTPGHMGNHLAFRLGDQLFCGDIVLGWSSTLISPPDGDLADYFRSLDLIEATGVQRMLPAHGDPVEDVPARLDELRAHRRLRTAQILAELSRAPGSPADLTRRIYDVPEPLVPAAERNVFAHLAALWSLGAVQADPTPCSSATFRLA